MFLNHTLFNIFHEHDLSRIYNFDHLPPTPLGLPVDSNNYIMLGSFVLTLINNTYEQPNVMF